MLFEPAKEHEKMERLAFIAQTAVRFAGPVAVLVGCLLMGTLFHCGKKQNLVQEETRSAYAQLNKLQGEVLNKVAAENRYYEGTLQNIVEDVGRTRTIVLDRFLRQRAAQFQRQNGAGPSAAALTSFMEDVAGAWRINEAERRQVIENARNALENNLDKIAADQDKINALKTKLQALAKEPNSRAKLAFLADYAQGTRAAFEKLKEEESSGDNQP